MVQQTAKNKSKRGASRRVSQNKTTGQLSIPMNCPVYRPVYKFSRTLDRIYDVNTDGINPALFGFLFRLSNLPSFTDFTNLFDMYRITKVEIEWLPEYTELTDAALVSNAVNVRFNSCVDISDAAAPGTVAQILQYQNLKTSSITKPHKQTFVPAFLMGGLVPCTCWLPTSNPAENHYGVKVAIEPTGVPMNFTSKVKIHVECANVN
jgi:hypothetical protein